jgi:hypothetical protein
MVTMRRGILHPISQVMKSEMVKDVHVVLGKWKRTGKNTGEDDIWKKQSIFWELPY